MTDFSTARGIADAILYEGYLLFPYTASSHKNSRVRWQFGVVVPHAYEAYATGEHGYQQTEIRFASEGTPRIDVVVRFLHVQARTIEAWGGDMFRPVGELSVDGTRHLTFEETVEREIAVTYEPAVIARLTTPIAIAGGSEIEELRDAAGALAGRIVRTRWPLSGQIALELSAVDDGPGIARLRIRLENDSAIVEAAERGMVLRTAFVSAHTLAGISGGTFHSPIDPPANAVASATRLANEHTWPVLIGGTGASDPHRSSLILSSPIILADFPQIAKKTEADAFDATEIDELLTLSVLSLSDAERAEARATDPRARAIIDRAEAFGATDIARLHDGASECVASERVSIEASESVPVFGSFDTPDPRTAAAPQSVRVSGVTVAKGSSVRLAPKRRADAWDMFLAGKTATVQAIHQDFEERVYVAVTIDEDPASEYHEWYGRSFFFDTDEVEPLERAG